MGVAVLQSFLGKQTSSKLFLMSEIVSSVYGEAIESDSDEEEGSMGMIGERLPLGVPTAGPVPLRTLSAQPGVVVQGEASETDDSEDDEDDDEARIKNSSSDPAGIRHAGLPPLKGNSFCLYFG